MTVRSEWIGTLFGLARAGRPDVEWVEGFAGEHQAREIVWVQDIDGPLSVPVVRPPVVVVQDEATVTIQADSMTGGSTRLEALGLVEAYLTDLITLIASDPQIGLHETGVIESRPTQLRGPYCIPNPVESGWAATAQLDLRFIAR